MSFSDVKTSKMELTPCRVSYKAPNATAHVDLGGTLDGVTVSMKYMKSEIKADQSGETVRDRRVSGIEVTVTTALAEVKNIDLWEIIFPHGKRLTGGGYDAFEFRENMGSSDLDNAGELKLHPLSFDDTDLSHDLIFYKACANAESELVFSPTEQQKLNIVWNVLPDESVTGQANRFFRYGHPNAV